MGFPLTDCVECPRRGGDLHAFPEAAEHTGRPSSCTTAVDRCHSQISLNPELSPTRRKMLVNWLREVQYHCQISSRTYQHAVDFVDRFVALEVVPLDRFQCLGLAAMVLASAVHEQPGNVFSVYEANYLGAGSAPVSMIEDFQIRMTALLKPDRKDMCLLDRLVAVETVRSDSRLYEMCEYFSDIAVLTPWFQVTDHNDLCNTILGLSLMLNKTSLEKIIIHDSTSAVSKLVTAALQGIGAGADCFTYRLHEHLAAQVQDRVVL